METIDLINKLTVLDVVGMSWVECRNTLAELKHDAQRIADDNLQMCQSCCEFFETSSAEHPNGEPMCEKCWGKFLDEVAESYGIGAQPSGLTPSADSRGEVAP